ncbi:uncharacterized protein LOC106181750 isoform X2 [Lingula anatina]|uniref:Uncharacterized protein LOC106181750 isoform X2 n=1 Tax=Lingula anatina TaxID=7574 RepID=A0A1S3KGU4_LINAN|nr:uncharacterized protein LOC106181750 isoform X2 [Lingula anatina]|eukprot:XP_013421679.1 uncharacterized protein LOC106181750 isoform X2 [Lingula anatina]
MEDSEVNTEGRKRQLTEKGTEHLHSKISPITTKLDKLSAHIDTELMNFSCCDLKEIEEIQIIKDSICTLWSKYQEVFTELSGVLKRNPSDFSDEERMIAQGKFASTQTKVDMVMAKIDKFLFAQIKRPGSIKSERSMLSTQSLLAQQKAKLEAARVRLDYAQREAEFKSVQAEMEKASQEMKTKVKILETEKELAVAEAEYQAVKEMSEEDDDKASSVSLQRTRTQRTRAYVETGPHTGNNILSQAATFPATKFVPSRSEIRAQEPNTSTGNPSTERMYLATEFSKHLLRKDLLMTRFMNFNDEPQDYPAWKENFKSIIQELGANDREQLDLLVKFLGPKSSQQARSLRNASANDASLAIRRIWERLEERYGRPELIDAALKSKVASFPKISGPNEYPRLYELLDILHEIEFKKEDPAYKDLLCQWDTSTGVNLVLHKLPFFLQNKWIDRAAKYKSTHSVPYPPFEDFVVFVREMSSRCNDPSFSFSFPAPAMVKKQPPKSKVSTFKTEVANPPLERGRNLCPLHNVGHSLNTCRAFRKKSIDERKKILKENHICYRCCETNMHLFRDCKNEVKCQVCGRTNHATAMHIEITRLQGDSGETPSPNEDSITTKCTTLCGEGFSGRSCAKTILVNVFPAGQPEKSIRVYAVHDDQSNRTLGNSSLFDKLQLASEQRHYTVSSCSGTSRITTRYATNLIVQSVDKSCEIKVPNIIECSVPNERSEIPTPEVTSHFEHLAPLANSIPPLDTTAQIGLLIGRDVLEAHHVQQQIVGPRNSPFAQKLPLGWVVVGEVCLGQFHRPDLTVVNAYKTHFTRGGRPTIMSPCTSGMIIKDSVAPEDNIFKTTRLDERVGMSQDDVAFLTVMENSMVKDADGHLKAPLPFKHPRPTLPNNRPQALRRARLLATSLKKNTQKEKDMVEFMGQIIESRAAEEAPKLAPETEFWFLPLFGVYHPRKPNKIRGVFDSSAEYEGLSLNSVLLSGPNLTNSLLGVLLRFRRNKVAITTDIHQMFYSFRVNEEHRNFLRFFWFRNNDPREDMIEYRMRVHVFGNTPSPAVATYGLRKAVEDAEDDVRNFVHRDFYVDDGLASCPTESEAISLVKRTQATLQNNAKIKLHKIASNSPAVMKAFKAEDLDKSLRSIDLFEEELPQQASLGLVWELKDDAFIFKLNMPERPPTRRGILSAISSIFDPLGFLTPITTGGRILLREITESGVEWDQPLVEDLKTKWEAWKSSLNLVVDLQFPRMFVHNSWCEADYLKVHVFADASESAISAVAFAQVVFGQEVQSGFLMGKSKLSPPGGTTIPRLELCAAVLATDLADTVSGFLDVKPEDFVYHSDSKVVLGYLYNRTKRFYTYVSNRVQAVLKRSKAHQWQYIPSQKNPADCGTRGNYPVKDFTHSLWINGPDLLRCENIITSQTHDLVNPANDKEIRQEISVAKIAVTYDLQSKFEKFSTWPSLIRAFSALKRRCSKRPEYKESPNLKTIEETVKTENLLIKVSQDACFPNEMSALREGQPLSHRSSILALSPFLDQEGIMRVGGRLNQAPVAFDEKHPVIIDGKSHFAKLLVAHFHREVFHQGRLITETAIRKRFWITGVKRIISSMIYKCVPCRKLRGRVMNQQMADLPKDRLTSGPPFAIVGVDVFGPWSVVARRTRGGMAESKRWGVLFTCLFTRAVHIELVESMSSDAFINAMRRFVAIRGPVTEFRSDRGTNFVGALEDVQAQGIFVEGGPVQEYLIKHKIIWRFNPPHASHMGGIWERMIGITRRILDGMFLNRCQKLTHDVLCTLMHEVSAIINSRPIGPISTDPDYPEVITPAMLLTQKTEGLPALTDSVNLRDIYRSQWKHVQVLANTFWKRWRQSYLQNLQSRSKWQIKQPDLKEGDIVLLRDINCSRNEWPMGLVVKTFPSKTDKAVRTVEVRVKGGKTFS